MCLSTSVRVCGLFSEGALDPSAWVWKLTGSLQSSGGLLAGSRGGQKWEEGWIMLQGLQTNRAQLFFNWAPHHTHTHTAHVCRSLFSNFPAVGSVELNTLVEEQPSDSLHMGSVLVVWLVNPGTNQGLWQQPGHINLRTQSQHKPELSASHLVLACALSWAEWRIQKFIYLFIFPQNYAADFQIWLSMHQSTM